MKMTKKALWFILISMFLISLVAFGVSAADESFTGKMREGFSYVTQVVGTFFMMFSENPGVWMKLLMWIAVFTALFYSGQKLHIDKKLAGVLAAVLAFMVMIVIPNDVLIAVATAYGAMVITLLIAIPFIFIVLFTISKAGGSCWTYWGIALVWIVFLMIMSALENSFEKTVMGPGKEIVGPAATVIVIMWVIGILVILFLIIWGIIKTGGGATVKETVKGGGKGAVNLVKKGVGLLRREQVLEVTELKLLNKIEAELNKEPPRFVEAKKLIEKAESEDVRGKQIDAYILYLNESLKSKEHPRARQLEIELERLSAFMIKEFKNMNNILADTYVLADRGNKNLARNAIKKAIGIDKNIIAQTKLLLRLEVKIKQIIS